MKPHPPSNGDIVKVITVKVPKEGKNGWLVWWLAAAVRDGWSWVGSISSDIWGRRVTEIFLIIIK